MSTQITGLQEIACDYAHIYLSPHLDDAVLSCGGTIARHIAAGQQVLVITVCAGMPPAGTPFNALAQELHAAYGSDDAWTAQELRLHEDATAMEAIGADFMWLDFLDSIYRMPEAYVSDPTIFGRLVPNDPLSADIADFMDALHKRCPDAIVYAPLGVGNHVDHQAVFGAAKTLALAKHSVTFYEDLPYAARRAGSVDRRLEVIGGKLVPNVIDIDATLARKLSAIDAYVSQVERLFGDSNAMIAAVTSYAENVREGDYTYGERLWLPM